MKILLASSAGIYDNRYPETSKNQNGFGIMIRSLADMLAFEGDSVDIITQSNITKGRDMGKSRLLAKTWWKLICHTKLFYIKKALHFCRQKDLSVGLKLRSFLYFMTGSYCEYLITKEKYDVVHINGIGESSVAYMYACIRTNTPFVLTLHGLISFDDTIKTQRFNKRMEREFYKFTKENPKALSTVISTGIKKRLENFLETAVDGIHVVCNPIIASSLANSEPYKKKDNEKIIVCIGNITKNKNQKLVVDSFNKLCEKYEGHYKLFVIGKYESDLRKYAEENNIKNVVFTGGLEKNVVNDYYNIADLCVTGTLNEGFGLPLVEAYSYGVPCVMSRTIDPFPDLGDEMCCVPAESYDVNIFADAMYKALTKKWNAEKIIDFSNGFTEKTISAKYLMVLRRAAEYKEAPFNMEVMDSIIKASEK